jgi:hypothetical protein
VARLPAETFTFGVDRVDPVVAVMEQLRPARGWLVLQPGFDAEAVPPPRRSSGFFSAKGPYVPVLSWVPGEHSRQGVEYVALGIQHGTGARAEGWLVEQRHPVPVGWEVLDDHPGRGLVVAVPPPHPDGEVLAWLLDAGDLLCPVQLTGEWRATVHRR